MAISPLQMEENIVTDEELLVVSETEKKKVPSKTYQLNLETGEIENRFVDGREAMKQAIYKMLMTPRYRYLMYSSDYGSELEELIRENLPYEMLEIEVPRYIRECLLVDNRIFDIRDFAIDRFGDAITVGFVVELSDGDTWYEEVQI